MNQFLLGAVSMAGWIAGLCFIRFWRLTRDRLFVFFALAFWGLSVNWITIAFANPVSEAPHRIYFIRLFAFALIIVGVIDKNRRA